MEENGEHAPNPPIKAWLTALTGPEAGCRYAVDPNGTRVGTGADAQVVPVGARAASAAPLHFTVTCSRGRFAVHDAGSPAGTYLDGERVASAVLAPGSVLMLGEDGARFRLVVEEDSAGYDTASREAGDTGETGKRKRPRKPITRKDEAALTEAVARARELRKSGGADTVVIMREVLQEAVHRGKRKHKAASLLLLVALAVVSIYSAARIHHLNEKKNDLDERIQWVEERLQQADEPEHLNALIGELEEYQRRALDIQRNLLYKIGHRDAEEDFIIEEISRVMEAFGAPEYSIPPEFVDRVQVAIVRFQDTHRDSIERAIGPSRKDFETIRRKLAAQRLPPDLAYMVLVESAFDLDAHSRADAAGPWQFVPGTARAYGLKVGKSLDERYDVDKSTQAAGRYIRHLILEFGSGDGVMLALAAYNLGPTKVKRAIRKVEDPIRQRDFWYLYRMRALPKETREYVPKVIAAIVIGRNPERFGFHGEG